MKAVGDYACIEIENTITSSGIQVKNDGIGVCLSCPSKPDLIDKRVLFDINQKFYEYEYMIFIDSKFIMGVIE
jgi:hypothetical protein